MAVDLNEIYKDLDNELGTGLGDLVQFLARPMATLMKMGNCSPCTVRKLILNAYINLSQSYGRLEALRIMKELWAMSSKEDGNTVLMKLRTYIMDGVKNGNSDRP